MDDQCLYIKKDAIGVIVVYLYKDDTLYVVPYAEIGASL